MADILFMDIKTSGSLTIGGYSAYSGRIPGVFRGHITYFQFSLKLTIRV